jgi:cytidylate kinase
MGIPSTIAIDGPAASGKSTLAQMLAAELGYLYFDTGVMYRALTWVVLERKIDLGDEKAISDLAEQIDIDVCPPSRQDGRAYDVLADGEDLTLEIRRPEVDANVSVVSAYAGVRQALSAQQRRIGQRGRVVMVGRDIGTIVLPEADLKIYLDATVEQRALRRYKESIARGEVTSLNAVLKATRKRDQIDSTRSVSPLHPAQDAVILNTENLNAEQVLEKVKLLVYKGNLDG